MPIVADTERLTLRAAALVLASMTASTAHADAVWFHDMSLPGADCTHGHGGGCVPMPCSHDTDCHDGTRCYEWRLCTQSFDVPPWMGPPAPPTRTEWVVRSCPRGADCLATIDAPRLPGTATGDITCRDGLYCIVPSLAPLGAVAVDPSPARPPPVAPPPGCGCRACGSRSIASVSMAALALAIALGLRRRVP